jgi:putative SOS response-associated peptidase YedK
VIEASKDTAMNTVQEITGDGLIKAGHRALLIALGWYEWEALRRDSDPDPLDELLQFEDEELATSLLLLAAIARVREDESGILVPTEGSSPLGFGYLETGGSRRPLSLHDACNRVIHSRSRKADLAWASENPVW